MEEGIIRMIKKAVIRGIGTTFSYPVYAEEVAGRKKEDCFTVSLKKTEGKRLLGNRQEVRATFLVTYIPKPPFFREKIEEVSLGLRESLEEIKWQGEGFLASGIEEKTENNQLLFSVTYYFQMFPEENQERMEYLEQRGGFVARHRI